MIENIEIGSKKACGNRGVVNFTQFIPFTARILHTTLGGFHSHVSTGQSPLIPSSHLSKGWRPVFLSERVSALLRNTSGTPCFL